MLAKVVSWKILWEGTILDWLHSFLHLSFYVLLCIISCMQVFVSLISACLGAQLDARRTCDQEFAGSTPVGSATFFHDHEIFFMVILSLLLIQEEQLSVSGERMCTIMVNCLKD